MSKAEEQSTKWRPDEDEFLAKNYFKMSTSQIGFHLKRSKNSVISRAHRIKVAQTSDRRPPMGSKSFKATSYARGPKPPQRLNLRNNNLSERSTRSPDRKPVNLKRRTPIVIIETVEPLNGVGVSLFDLKEKHCRWVLGDPVEFTFCGNDKAPFSSYCLGHHSKTIRIPTNDNPPGP